jgi:RNA polymerase sigma-70 factor (family 1)
LFIHPGLLTSLIASTPYNESELLLQIANGNEKAFRRVFDHYWKHIWSIAFDLTKSPVVAEEIVQDVFMKIWLKRDQLPSVSKFDAYLFIVARNHIYNTLRKKTAEQPFVKHLEQHFLETSALPEQELLLKETSLLINKAVEQLPGQQRSVFELSRQEGLDHTTIAEKLNISKLTVKSHLNKALHFIRRYLQTHSDALLLLACLIRNFL